MHTLLKTNDFSLSKKQWDLGADINNRKHLVMYSLVKFITSPKLIKTKQSFILNHNMSIGNKKGQVLDRKKVHE